MQEVDLNQAIEVLKRGDLLLYPTETFYGLGADIQNEAALQKIFRLKGREQTKPVSVLVAAKVDIPRLVKEVNRTTLILIDQFLPGPLTLVLPASKKVSPLLHANTGWVGIRMSSHPLAQQLVQSFGGPITTTSANPSGNESGRALSQLKEYFQDQKDLSILSGGDLPPSKGSTVVKVEANQLILLREGDLSFSEIERALKR